MSSARKAVSIGELEKALNNHRRILTPEALVLGEVKLDNNNDSYVALAARAPKHNIDTLSVFFNCLFLSIFEPLPPGFSASDLEKYYEARINKLKTLLTTNNTCQAAEGEKQLDWYGLNAIQQAVLSENGFLNCLIDWLKNKIPAKSAKVLLEKIMTKDLLKYADENNSRDARSSIRSVRSFLKGEYAAKRINYYESSDDDSEAEILSDDDVEMKSEKSERSKRKHDGSGKQGGAAKKIKTEAGAAAAGAGAGSGSGSGQKSDESKQQAPQPKKPSSTAMLGKSAIAKPAAPSRSGAGAGSGSGSGASSSAPAAAPKPSVPATPLQIAEAKLKEVAAQLEAAKIAAKEMQEQEAKAKQELASADQALAAANAEAKNAEKVRAEAIKNMADTIKSIERLENDIKDVENEKAKATGQLSAADQAAAQAQTEAKAAMVEVEKARDAVRLATLALEAAERRTLELKAKVAAKLQEAKDAKTNLGKVQDVHKQLSDCHKDRAGEIPKSRELHENVQKHVAKVLADQSQAQARQSQMQKLVQETSQKSGSAVAKVGSLEASLREAKAAVEAQKPVTLTITLAAGQLLFSPIDGHRMTREEALSFASQQAATAGAPAPGGARKA